MKLFKLSLLVSIVLSLIIILILSLKPSLPQSTFNPKSDKNDFYQNLNLAINTSKLSISSITVRDFTNEVEFFISQDNQTIKVILSDNIDPFWQISSLQDILKTAKMNQQQLKLVDLSSAHPYATFKNN